MSQATKIQSTSSGNDRYSRRDFGTANAVDKYGNKIAKDLAGNSRLVAKEDGVEPDFTYQKKYNVSPETDNHGNFVVNLSLENEENFKIFFEDVVNASKGLLDGGKFRKQKMLPNGEESIETEDVELSEDGVTALEKLINNYNAYKNQNEALITETPRNITLKSLVYKSVENFSNEEKEFVANLATYLETDVDSVLDMLDSMRLESDQPQPIAVNKPEVTKVTAQESQCVHCGESLPEMAKFCSNCGTKDPFILTCGDCGFVVSLSNKFCANCGTKLNFV